MKAVQIFIVSYAKDFKWLNFNLRSIRKHARGFRGVTVLVPQQDAQMAIQFCAPFGAAVATFKEEPGKGFNHHQAMVCHADLYANGAQYVLHTDSDCIFTESVTPDDYFTDGKPQLMIERYDRVLGGGTPDQAIWKDPTERALGFQCDFECMRRHPAVHPVDLYIHFRAYMNTQHGDFVQYVLSQKNDFPQGFSEFNALGAFALARFRDRYAIIEKGKDPEPKNKLEQSWSRFGWPENANEHAAKFAEICARLTALTA